VRALFFDPAGGGDIALNVAMFRTMEFDSDLD
jgi:hypothetical protein